MPDKTMRNLQLGICLRLMALPTVQASLLCPTISRPSCWDRETTDGTVKPWEVRSIGVDRLDSSEMHCDRRKSCNDHHSKNAVDHQLWRYGENSPKEARRHAWDSLELFGKSGEPSQDSNRTLIGHSDCQVGDLNSGGIWQRPAQIQSIRVRNTMTYTCFELVFRVHS